MNEPVTIGVSAWKGGVGKSTTSVYLAALLARETDAGVAFVDRDASRNLTAMVAQRPDLRDELAGREVSLVSGEEIPPRRKGFAYIVIDTPLGDRAIAALRDATLVVLPVKPEDQSSGNFVKHVEQLDDARLAVSPTCACSPRCRLWCGARGAPWCVSIKTTSIISQPSRRGGIHRSRCCPMCRCPPAS